MTKVGHGYISTWLWERDGHMECSEWKSRTTQKLYSLVFFTLRTVFQWVGIMEFAYRVDCWNIVRKSCCDQNDPPTVHLLMACLLGRASSRRNSCNSWDLSSLWVLSNGTVKVTLLLGIISAYQLLCLFCRWWHSHPSSSCDRYNLIKCVGGRVNLSVS